jgi:hypothetical protein
LLLPEAAKLFWRITHLLVNKEHDDGSKLRYLWQRPKLWQQGFTLTGKDTSSLESKYSARTHPGSGRNKASERMYFLP